MSYKKSNSLLFLFALSVSGIIYADDTELATSFSVTDKQFSYERNRRKIHIHLKPTMSSWIVNCDRTRAVVWGRAWSELKLGDRPFSRAYLVDIENDKVMGQITTTDGLFSVSFSKDRKLVRVDNWMFDLASGRVLDESPWDINLVAESCPPFFGKQSDDQTE